MDKDFIDNDFNYDEDTCENHNAIDLNELFKIGLQDYLPLYFLMDEEVSDGTKKSEDLLAYLNPQDIFDIGLKECIKVEEETFRGQNKIDLLECVKDGLKLRKSEDELPKIDVNLIIEEEIKIKSKAELLEKELVTRWEELWKKCKSDISSLTLLVKLAFNRSSLPNDLMSIEEFHKLSSRDAWLMLVIEARNRFIKKFGNKQYSEKLMNSRIQRNLFKALSFLVSEKKSTNFKSEDLNYYHI